MRSLSICRGSIHDGEQVYRIKYFDASTPVVTPIHRLSTGMYTELSNDIETSHGNSKDHVVKLLSILYGQKQANVYETPFWRRKASVLIFSNHC
ncbi:hypothetical protein ACHAW6_003664 [Cyclotella cf. meneghiniana]